jgi:hypothetical protein
MTITDIEKEFDERFHDTCWHDGEYDKKSVKSFYRQKITELLEGMNKAN